MKRALAWFLLLGSLAFILGLKAVQRGWFAPRPPLEMNGEPAILFFNKSRGCECELFVYNNARAQIEAWDAPIQVFQIDFDRRPDLVKQFRVVRAPTLILVNAKSEIVWKQDVGISDASPLNLEQLTLVLGEMENNGLLYP